MALLEAIPIKPVCKQSVLTVGLCGRVLDDYVLRYDDYVLRYDVALKPVLGQLC